MPGRQSAHLQGVCQPPGVVECCFIGQEVGAGSKDGGSGGHGVLRVPQPPRARGRKLSEALALGQEEEPFQAAHHLAGGRLQAQRRACKE